MAGGARKKQFFFDSFWQFFVLFFAFSPTIYITKRYSEKKLGLACFFLWQEPLIQKSAAPQGSPPPTQQISEIQLSWAINYSSPPIKMVRGNSKIGPEVQILNYFGSCSSNTVLPQLCFYFDKCIFLSKTD